MAGQTLTREEQRRQASDGQGRQGQEVTDACQARGPFCASLASEQTGTSEGQGKWRNPTLVLRRRRQARLRGTGPLSSGEWNAVITGWIIAKVIGVGPQASLQQEDSQGRHAHQRGSSPRRFRSHFLARNIGASMVQLLWNIWWCATRCLEVRCTPAHQHCGWIFPCRTFLRGCLQPIALRRDGFYIVPDPDIPFHRLSRSPPDRQ